jgi:hypothetical protein
MKWIVITPHQGLGDHIICNAIYREYSKKYSRVFITIKQNYKRELLSMFEDVSNISFLVMPNRRSWTTTRIIQLFARLLRIRVLGLGSYGDNFFPPNIRFDNNFYDQACLPFDLRWSSFKVNRNKEKENYLYYLLGCDKGDYIFLHEDISRNFVIDRNKVPKNLNIIEPSMNTSEFNLVDYSRVIEDAKEIHVIESSFSAYIESLPIDIPVYAHRYSREHALKDFRHEFTYKKPWVIFLT